MVCIKSWYFSQVTVAVASLIIVMGSIAAEKQERLYPEFNSNNFGQPTVINNPWFPLIPGTQFVLDGKTVDDEGQAERHTVVFTVTNLTKVIDGVRTVVCWDQDYADGELVEAEIVFFAQDNDGNVWHFGQYPEEYEDGELIASPGWLHGINGNVGIHMPANPKMGDDSFSQGWAPSIPWTDRGIVHATSQKVTVPLGTYDEVLVIAEYNREEPGARQLKYYARHVGNIKVGSVGDAQQEVLELVQVEKLAPKELGEARERALALAKRANMNCKEVFVNTNELE